MSLIKNGARGTKKDSEFIIKIGIRKIKRRGGRSNKKWREKNKEKVKAIQRKWRLEHKESDDFKKRYQESRRNYYCNNRKKCIERSMEWHKKHPDYQKEWREKNSDKIRMYNKRRYQKNKEYYREYYKKYRKEKDK